MISDDFPDFADDSSRSLILASASERRYDLLLAAGYECKVIHPAVDESKTEREFESTAVLKPFMEPIRQVGQHVQVAMANAAYKARSVALSLPPSENTDVIGADTVISMPGHGILGKPKGGIDARRMLEAMSGTFHRVLTGVSVIRYPEQKMAVGFCSTTVQFHPIASPDIDEYIDSGEWEGKAGAYAIQGKASRFVKALDGQWDNVVGLPISTFRALLYELNETQEN